MLGYQPLSQVKIIRFQRKQQEAISCTTVLQQTPQRKQDSNNKQHVRQNKEMPDIYSLHTTKHNWALVSASKKTQDISQWVSQKTLMQPVLGSTQSQEWRTAESRQPRTAPCLGLPAVQLLKMTRGKWSDVVLQKGFSFTPL